MVLKYQKGFKFRVEEDFYGLTSVHPPEPIETDFIQLSTTGQLHIRKGYAWDGPSGFAIDTRNFMRGSLVHDALYQLIRREFLPLQFRKVADAELLWYCLEDGMSRFRAWYVNWAVRRFARFAALPESRRVTLEAP